MYMGEAAYILTLQNPNLAELPLFVCVAKVRIVGRRNAFSPKRDAGLILLQTLTKCLRCNIIEF